MDALLCVTMHYYALLCVTVTIRCHVVMSSCVLCVRILLRNLVVKTLRILRVLLFMVFFFVAVSGSFATISNFPFLDHIFIFHSISYCVWNLWNE